MQEDGNGITVIDSGGLSGPQRAKQGLQETQIASEVAKVVSKGFGEPLRASESLRSSKRRS